MNSNYCNISSIQHCCVGAASGTTFECMTTLSLAILLLLCTVIPAIILVIYKMIYFHRLNTAQVNPMQTVTCESSEANGKNDIPIQPKSIIKQSIHKIEKISHAHLDNSFNCNQTEEKIMEDSKASEESKDDDFGSKKISASQIKPVIPKPIAHSPVYNLSDIAKVPTKKQQISRNYKKSAATTTHYIIETPINPNVNMKRKDSESDFGVNS